jgi:hypothetical protein
MHLFIPFFYFLLSKEGPLENKDSVKQKWYSSLKAAKEKAAPVDGLASTLGKLSIDEAYHVQDMLIRARLQKGQKFIGWKVGATSQSVMRQLKIHEPIYGCMTSESDYSLLKKICASDFCKPAVEGEIAVILGKDLQGTGFTSADVINATAGIMGAVELVDCRTRGWKPAIEEAVAGMRCRSPGRPDRCRCLARQQTDEFRAVSQGRGTGVNGIVDRVLFYRAA